MSGTATKASSTAANDGTATKASSTAANDGTATKASSTTANPKRRLTRSRTAGSSPSRSTPAKSDAPVVDVDVRDDPVVQTGDTKAALAASETDLAKLRAARRAKLIKATALTAIALIFITFVLQNDGPVGVRLLAWTVSIRLIWVIVASAILGAVGGYLVGRPDKILLHGPNRRDEDPL